MKKISDGSKKKQDAHKQIAYRQFRIMSNLPVKILCITVALLLYGCASEDDPLQQGKISTIRSHALSDTAMTYGAQYGLALRAQSINQMLKEQSQSLDKIYNFNDMLLAHNVMPPVLAESRNSINLNDPNTLRLADRVYKIIKPAIFVTTPPTWRNYLSLSFEPPTPPDFTLLPHTEEERKVWNKALIKGWENGLIQANQVFSANLGRLTRDINGMVLYRTLLSKNMVIPPYVARAKLGVTGDTNHLRINDQVLRITSNVNLVPNSRIWIPALSQNTDQQWKQKCHKTYHKRLTQPKKDTHLSDNQKKRPLYYK